MTDSAESLIDATRLREWAKAGTGRGVRVAILDTGVEASHPALEGRVSGCYEVVSTSGSLGCVATEGTDPVGHGTACAGIVHSIAPEAEIVSVRVLGKSAYGAGEAFLYALHWILEEGDVDILNLSLGTLQKRFQPGLQELADRAYFAGILAIAAAHNRKLVSYPSHFASLVGVSGDDFSDPLEFQFLTGKPIEVVARGVQVRAPSPGGKYQLWTGTSFACPHVAGLAARLKSMAPDLTPFEFKTFLRTLRSNATG